MKGKKRRYVDAATQTDEDLIEVLVAKRWVLLLSALSPFRL